MFSTSKTISTLEIETYRLYEHLIFSNFYLYDRINDTKLNVVTGQFLNIEL